MRNITKDKALFSVTPKAAEKIEQSVEQRSQSTLGIRVSVKKKGCSGNAYTLEYVEKIQPLDEVVNSNGIKIFIDPKAVLFVLGTEMDYTESKLESGFKFVNPNEKGRCGCGESFYV